MKNKPLALTIPSVEVCLVFKNFFGFGLSKSAILYRSLLEFALAPHGIIAPQLGMLYLLKLDSAPLSQNDLAKKLGIDKASMVKMIYDLEIKKLILRKIVKNDRRARVVVLTQQGAHFLTKLSVIHKRLEKETLACFKSNERKLLKELLPRLLIGLIKQAKGTKKPL